MIVAILTYLLYLILLAIVIYIVIYVLQAIGIPIPPKVVQLIWLAVLVIALIFLVGQLLPQAGFPKLAAL